MAYYISVHPFSRKKNDQIWEQILKDEFEQEINKEYSKLEKELKNINENPRVDLDYELQQQEESLKRKQERLEDLKRMKLHLDEAILNKDKIAIAECVENIEANIARESEEIDYFGTRYPFHEFFTALFKIVLNVRIEDDFEDTLERVPFEKWIELYKKINSDAMKEAIGATQDDPEDLESLRYYADLTRHMRDIIKYCIDTGSELYIYDELYCVSKEKPKDSRIEEIIKKIIKN